MKKQTDTSMVKILTYRTWKIDEARDLIEYLHSKGYGEIYLPHSDQRGWQESISRNGQPLAQVIRCDYSKNWPGLDGRTSPGPVGSNEDWVFELGVRDSGLEKIIDRYLDRLKGGRWKV